MTIHVRPYIPQDFAEAYAAISAATEVDGTRRVNADALQSPLDEKLIRAAVAINRTKAVVGITTLEPLDRGYLVQGWVHPNWRGQGAGSALLSAIENELRHRLVKRTGCISRIYADIPGAEALFRNQRYEVVRRFYNMAISLKDRQFDIALPPGLTFRPFEVGDLPALVEADNEFFTDHWGTQPRSVSEWKYQLIDSRPHDPSLWVVVWDRDQIVGECLCHASLQGEANDGWVAVVGVRRQWRGRGLGRAVLSCGLQHLQHLGYETASLHVDSENAPALKLYRSLGMEIARTRIHFRKAMIPMR